MSPPSTSNPKPIERVNLACVQCRSRHVKCDATTPICNRCKRDGKDCEYAKSRRGGLDKAALARRRLALQQQSAKSNHTPESNASSSSGDRNNQSGDRDSANLELLNSISISSNELSFAVSSDRLIQLYYDFFHAGHPFVLPQRFFALRLQSGHQDMNALEAVMLYIGSRYAPWTTSDLYREKAERLLAAAGENERSPFHVQALLLFSISQHYCSQWSEASGTLEAAIRLAYALGMNLREFAGLYGERSAVLEESWRRTFWTLFITDQHYAIVRRILDFTLRDLPAVSVDLPCEEGEYESGLIPKPKTMAEYDMREFDEIETVFSSFTYLLDTMRIICYLVRTYGDFKHSWDIVTAGIDARLAAWNSLLPSCKKDAVLPDGTVDEVMFFAHCTIIILTVQLHRPMSSIVYSKEEWQTGFLPSPPVSMMQTKPDKRHVHTAKVLRALEKQTQLLTLPSPLMLHSPFTTCIIAGCAAAHVSTCSLFPDDRRLAVGRDRLRLSIGAVRACADVWPLVRIMLQETQMIAKGTLSPTPPISYQTSKQPFVFPDPDPRKETIDFDFSIGPMSEVDIFSALEVPSVPQDWSLLFDPSSLPAI